MLRPQLDPAGYKLNNGEVLVSLALVLFNLFAAPHVVCAQGDFQGATHMMPFDEDTIKYSQTASTGPIARLQTRIDQGEVRLGFDDKYGYLPGVLKALGVESNSQMLVFSKTSFQRDRISPSNPRAVYFNDEVYVGYVPGSPLLEFSEAAPKLGGVFYTLEQKRIGKQKFTRSDQCLECHASAKTMGVPGHLVRSFKTDDQGVVDLATGVSLVTHRTPFEDRWGGWFVTGQHGAMPHRGNLVGMPAFERQAKDPNYMGNLENLDRFFSPQNYLQPGSDVVALLVLEHQLHAHNFLTRLHYESELSLERYGHVNYLKSATESFVKYLLFAEEAPLTHSVRGQPEFVSRFSALGPKDSKGRSLRDFDLQTRLFKHPCSYLIYSPAFDALPVKMRDRILQRLHEVLTTAETPADYQKLTAADRRAILEILIETKPSLPKWFTFSARAASGGS